MFNSILGTTLTLTNFIVCLLTALILGLVVALLHKKTAKSNANFITTLAILPILVSVVIILVNGNLGTGIAVAGAFSLIRFRSIPGNSREILNVFFAMAIGLATGTGYILFAIIFTLITSIMSILLFITKFGYENNNEKILKISIPEDLDYTDCFKDIFDNYLNSYTLSQAKTVNMGSMFELTYLISLKNDDEEKELIDKIRVRNGNLKVSITHPLIGNDTL